MPETFDRYARHRQVAGLEQDRLKRARVIVLGAGATGNELLKNLALLGVGTIEVYDLDTIEGHNLTRSVLFRDTDIAASKAETAAARARELDPNITLIPIHGNLFDTLTLDRVMRADCLIIGLDNLEARLRVNQLCLIAGVPLINTAIDARNVSVSWHPNKRAGEPPACFACNLSPNLLENLAARYSCGKLRNALAKDRLIPTTIITSTIAASMATSVLMRHLHGDAPDTAWVWNVDTYQGKSSNYAKRTDTGCAACASILPKREGLTWSTANHNRIQTLIAEGKRLYYLDALLDRVQCPQCKKEEPRERIHRTPVHRWTSALAVCPHCGHRAREVSHLTQLRSEDAKHFSAHPTEAPLVAFETVDGEAIMESETAFFIYRESNDHG